MTRTLFTILYLLNCLRKSCSRPSPELSSIKYLTIFFFILDKYDLIDIILIFSIILAFYSTTKNLIIPHKGQITTLSHSLFQHKDKNMTAYQKDNSLQLISGHAQQFATVSDFLSICVRKHWNRLLWFGWNVTLPLVGFCWLKRTRRSIYGRHLS